MDEDYAPEPGVRELQRQVEVLDSLRKMLRCERRGVCLMREWMRRYGTPGSSCACFHRFAEFITDADY